MSLPFMNDLRRHYPLDVDIY